MRRANLRVDFLLAMVVVFAAVAVLPGAVFGQLIYEEDFSDYDADDWESDTGRCEVKWCSGSEYTNSYNCGTPIALYLYGSSADDIVWLHVGDRGCTGAEIRFDYGQCAPYNSACLYPPYPSCYPTDDLSDSTLKFRVSTSDTFSCYTSITSLGANLNLTWTTAPECWPESHMVSLNSGDKAVYWKFDKGTHNCAMNIDNVEIFLYGCTCDWGPCVTELDEDFGVSFQSGAVCDLFPDTFETCEGNGPYISSGTGCGGTGDQCMIFGTGYPYSAAVLRCLDLSGQAAASLRFRYSKDDGSLGPELRASLDGEDYPYPPLWSAPFNFAGGCEPVCVDLADYLGEEQVWLKFISGTSSPTSGIDDIELVLGEACPCVDPVAEAGPEQSICPGDTATLDGGATGGSGGACPGDYSPSWSGPGIVSGGDTFTPVVNVTGTYTLTASCDTCEDQDTVEVVVGETPTVEAGADGILPCSGGELQLNGVVSGCTAGSTVQWTTVGGNIVSGADTLTPTVDATGSYTLHATCDGGCDASDDTAVVDGELGDWDGDENVDAADFAEFLSCLSGPGGGLLGPDCACGDFDSDWDVDLDDFDVFQTAFTG